jgi:hypothetical protein
LKRIGDKGRRQGSEARFGLLNGAIYELARGSKSQSVVRDVTRGNNDLFGIGCCSTAPGYDMASGWGSLVVSQFSQALGGIG